MKMDLVLFLIKVVDFLQECMLVVKAHQKLFLLCFMLVENLKMRDIKYLVDFMVLVLL